ncbi:MAG TPA: thermonuclease family protein [Anaerovoracaceae bacterium]|nr:thermonuclease family protein [Anaerovoracaceae bacterium]
MRLRLVYIFFIIFLLTSCGNDEVVLHGPYPVEHVRDGDTVEVMMEELPIDDDDISFDMQSGMYVIPIRMIGINCEESVCEDESRNTEFGKYASDNTKSILKDEYVYLEYDEDMLDKYGRLLAYVYYERDDEIVMINAELLETGMAEVMLILPNDKYGKRFNELEEEAINKDLGMWR